MTPTTRAKIFWGSVITGFLIMPVIFYAIMLVLVHVQPTNVQPNYEQTAANWDKDKAARLASEKLAWTVDLRTEPAADDPQQLQVAVSVYDKYGKPIRDAAVTIDVTYLDRTLDVVQVSPTYVPDERYTAPLPITRAGRWEFAVEVIREDDRYVTTFQKQVSLPRPSLFQPST